MMRSAQWLHAGGRALLRACFETLLLLPAIFVAAIYAIPEERIAIWIALIPLLHASGDAVNRLLAYKRRWLAETIVVALVLAIAYLQYGVSKEAFVTAVVYGFFTIRGTLRPVDGRAMVVHPGVYVIAFLLYASISFLYQNRPEWNGYIQVLNGCGVLTMLICLYLFNRSSIRKESYADPGSNAAVAQSMVRHNRLLVTVVAAAALLLSSIAAISDALNRLADSIFAALRRWLASEPEETKPPEPAAPAQPPLQPDEDPGGDSSWLLQLLETIAMYVAALIAVVVVLWIVYRIVRKLPFIAKLIEKWLLRLTSKEQLASGNDGYEDEVEQVSHSGAADRFRKWAASLRSGHDDEEWEQLPDNEARIRYLYRWALLRRERSGYKPKPQLTPRETAEELLRAGGAIQSLPAPMVEWYERARYGGSPIEDAEAQSARELVQRPTKRGEG